MNPKLYSNSASIVGRVFASAPNQIQVGNADTTSDYNHPIYFSSLTDPEYTINCTKYGGGCEIQGAKVRIPIGAKPAGGSDGHMAIIDQSTNSEYDFWQASIPSGSGGILNISFGGKTEILVDGLNSNATAGWFGLAAGNIRAYEWDAGTIDHALFITYTCDNGQIVYPAGGHGSKCSDATNAPPMGARFYLAMSDAEIDALSVPSWKKTALKAMAHYGMYIGDTGGGSTWAIKTESGSTYTSFNYADPFIAFAQKVGATKYGGTYLFDMSGIDYASKMKMIDPCVTQTGLADCVNPNPSSTATPLPSATSTVTMTPTPTPTPTPIPSGTMTVTGISMSYTKSGINKNIQTVVTVTDINTSAAISGATVSLNITLPSGTTYPYTGMTDSNGNAIFNKKYKETGTYSSTITNVTDSGYIYSVTNTTQTLIVN